MAANPAGNAPIATLLDTLNAVNAMAPNTVGLPADASPEDIAEFIDAAPHLNGASGLTVEQVVLKYTPDSMHMLIPEMLTYSEPDATAEDHARDNRLVVGVKPSVSLRGLNAVDCDAMKFLSYSVLWKLPDGVRLDQMPGKDHTASSLSLAGVITIAALNRPRYKHWLSALIIAVGCALGLVQKGGDGITKEWKAVKLVPTKENVHFFIGKLMGANGPKNWKIACDLIALLGYSRISHTHPVDSTNATQCDQQVALINRITGLEGTDVVTVEHLGEILHGPVHAMSLGGACGFYLAWIATLFASPFMKARGRAVGDNFKALALILAGYLSLTSLPILSGIAELSEGSIALVEDGLNQIGVSPCQGSSLSFLLCGLEPFDVPTRIQPTLHFLGALIIAAAREDILPSSFKTSRYLIGLSKKVAGAVEFWTVFFTSSKRAMERMSSAELTDAANNALGAVAGNGNKTNNVKLIRDA